MLLMAEKVIVSGICHAVIAMQKLIVHALKIKKKK